MSEGHNDNSEKAKNGATNRPDDLAEQKPVSYYYDDATNYEPYCEADDDEPAPTGEADP